MVQKETVLLICFFTGVTLVGGCARERGKPLPQPSPKERAVEAPVLGEETQARYVYAGEQFRDPFLPPGKKSGIVMGKKGIEVDIERLRLTGIMVSGYGERSALIDAGEGRGYIVSKGKLIDTHNRIVEGIAAVVRKDKVILITHRNVIKELRLRLED